MATPSAPSVAYVWIWLPGSTEPVVAGRLDRVGAIASFTYGASYRSRSDAIPLYHPELPLQAGTVAPEFLPLPSCIADAGPDAWGRRVVEARLHGTTATRTNDLDELVYLLESASDRIGALDFQASPSAYEPRGGESATLDELLSAAEAVAKGTFVAADLDRALWHGTSVGGARPKALLRDRDRSLIAKFSSSTDAQPNVQAEHVAMRLAARAGLHVASVELAAVGAKKVLLVERFDRPVDGTRRGMVSARTMLRLTETGIGASYADLADLIRARFDDAEATLHELFARITFNILCGNTDDHPRNHAAFWDGASLKLTPAYDISPEQRPSWESNQAMAIGPEGDRRSQLVTCLNAAATYHLSEREARAIIDGQISTIEDHWDTECQAAALPEADAERLRARQFLHPYALDSY